MNKALMFVLGAAAGSLLTWKIVEEKYKKITDEEIQSVKERYKNRENLITELTEDNSNVSDVELVEDKNEYKSLVKDLTYSEDEEEDYTVQVEVGEEYVAPFVIDPAEFGEMTGYDTKSWTYYSDGILENEIGEIVTDCENVIGDALDHFGDFDDDSVYVRNDNDECDYEILRSYKPFVNDGVEN